MPKISSKDLAVLKPVESADPADSQLVIVMDPAQPLPLGSYVFQLEVVDDADNTSAPATIRFNIVDTTAPNAIIDGPDRVSFKQDFVLSGKRSFDPDNGKITRFRWTRIQ